MPPLNDRASVEAFLNAHEPIAEPTLYAVGDEIGAWRIAAFLGRGGSGEVYRVTHVQLDVAAAMKVLSRDDSKARDRFRREAKILAEHSHSAFPRFLGYGEAGEHAYLVIEILEAMPLPNKDRDVARYLYKVCEGVAYLHGLGFVHRDIKPQNVLQRGVTGQPVLIDLGLVKDTTLPPAHEGVSLSIVDGQARGVGTPKYSAPEQFAGGTILPAADVHALGMLANECFGGKPPRAWERIIRRSTSSIPSQRYASVSEFVRAIRQRHKINVTILILVPLVLLILAVTIRTAWYYAFQSTDSGKRPDDKSQSLNGLLGKDVSREPSHQTVNETNRTTHAVVSSNLPRQIEGRQRNAANGFSVAADANVFMVPDDDHWEVPPRHDKAKGLKVISYPKSGVFVGDHEIDPNF